MPFASIEDAVAEIREGRMIIIVDDEDRENEGDLIVAADRVTPEIINFMAKHGRGLICMPITAARAQQLDLAPMTPVNRSLHASDPTFIATVRSVERVLAQQPGVDELRSPYGGDSGRISEDSHSALIGFRLGARPAAHLPFPA